MCKAGIKALDKQVAEATEERKEERVRRADEITALRNDTATIEAVEAALADFADLWDSLYLVSKNPLVFDLSPFKSDLASGHILPQEIWKELQCDSKERQDKDRVWRVRHVLLKETP